MRKTILLVEPDYYTTFPPLGLLKLAAYHRDIGDNVLPLVKGQKIIKEEPDLIYVTSLFTYSWREVHEAVHFYKDYFPNAEVWLGGIYASIMPDDAKKSGADYVHQGIFEKAESYIPAYDMLKEPWDGSIIFSSRGCIRNCGFCAVPKIEGRPNHIEDSIKKFVSDKHTKIIFFDNNILGAHNWRTILDELIEIGKNVDFNQGLDARLITHESAEKIAKLKIDKIRIAYDNQSMSKLIERGITHLINAGISPRKIFAYTLYNYTDTPQDFFERVRQLLNWGVVSYPMRFIPVLFKDKNKYQSRLWSTSQLEKVRKATRVIGYGGAFPPYDGLVNKFNEAKNFDEAFDLFPLEISKKRSLSKHLDD